MSAKQSEIDALKRRVRQLEAVVQAQQQSIGSTTRFRRAGASSWSPVSTCRLGASICRSLWTTSTSLRPIGLTSALKDLIRKSVYVFGRFDGWSPGFDQMDDRSEVRSVGRTRRLTLAAGYDPSEYFRLKLEYYHYLDDSAWEPGLSGHGAIAQVTGRF